MRMRDVLSCLAIVCQVAVGCTQTEETETQPAETAVESPSAPAASPEEAAQSVSTSSEAELARDLERANEILGNFAGDPNDLETAREIVISVLKRDRDYAPAYVSLARLEAQSGYVVGDTYDSKHLTNAEKFANHALSLDPDLADAHFLLARIRLARGEADGANEALATAEALNLDQKRVTALRAEIAASVGNTQEAVRLARQIITDESASPSGKAEMLTFISSILEREGFRPDAQDALEQVVALQPDDAWSHGNLAAFLLRHGETTRAIEHAERAVEIMPYPLGALTLAQAYLTRAGELHAERKYSEAGRYLDLLDKKLGEGNPDVLELTGGYYYRIFVRTSDVSYLDLAIEKYRAVVDVDPERKEAARTLQRLIDRKAEIVSR